MGSLAGFVIALNEEPLSYYMIIGFVLLAIVVSEYFRRKKISFYYYVEQDG